MDPFVIGGLILGFIGAKKELSNLLESFRSKISDFDNYFSLLQKISEESVYKYIHKRINFSEELSIIKILEKNILTGNTDEAKTNLSKLFHLSPNDIDSLIHDFKEKIIKSNSTELVLAIGLQSLEKINSLEKDVRELNQKIDKKETDLHETLSNLIELISSIINEGDLKEALDRLERINIDDLNGFNSFKIELALLESDIILKMGLSEKYALQKRKLERIPNSFRRSYFLLLLYRKDKNKDSFKFEDFEKSIELDPYTNTIKLLNDLIENIEFELNESEIERLDIEVKTKIIKQFLLNLINSNKPIRANEIVSQYEYLLKDKEARFYILINNLNLFHKEHPIKILSKSEHEYLSKLKEDFFKYESYYIDFDTKIRSSFYYNLSITLCRLGSKLAFNYYHFFKDDEKLVLGFIHFAKIAGFFDEIISLVERSKFKDQPAFISERILLKFEIGQYKDLVGIDVNSTDINPEAKSRVVLAQNIVLFNEQKEKFNEDNIVLLKEDRDNVLIYIYLSRMFHLINNEKLSETYLEKAILYIEVLTQNEKMHLAETAIELNRLEISKSLCETLFNQNPYSKLLYAETLRIETNGFSTPSIEVNKFFNSVNTTETLPLELYRIKIEYLFQQGEKDRAIGILTWLLENYDSDSDWYNYINMLIDSGNFSKAREQLDVLENKNQSPMILLATGIIHLITDSVSKLENFARYYFLAEKNSHLDNKNISESTLTPFWFYISRNNLYVSPEPEFIIEDVFVTLKDISNGDIIEICIHSDIKFEVPYHEEYMGCKHVHIENEIISDLKFKSAVILTYTDNCEKILMKRDEISKELISILTAFKNKKIIGEKNYYNKLTEVITDYPQVKLIPIIMSELEKSYEFTTIEDHTYQILSIDSIWNYPLRFLTKQYYTNPAQYGMKMISGDSDPLIGILPELTSDREKNQNILNSYLGGKISFFLFAHSNYEHYLGGIQTLLLEKNNYFLSGIGLSLHGVEKIAISYASLIYLEIFEKLQFLPLEKFVIPHSLYLEVQKTTKDLSDSIPIEQMSIALEDDSSLRKFVFDPDSNRDRARKLHEFVAKLKIMEIVDTINFEDEYTPFVKAIGKIEVDSIRISRNLHIPLIIDDEFIHKLLNGQNVTNFLPFYFKYSSENIYERLEFILKLSEMGYRYVIFQNFINSCIEYFLKDEGFLIGNNTPFDFFLKILKNEIELKHPLNINFELLRGVKTILNHFLSKNSSIIFQELWKILPKSLIEVIRFPITFHLPDLQVERNFILSCLRDIEKGAV